MMSEYKLVENLEAPKEMNGVCCATADNVGDWASKKWYTATAKPFDVGRGR